MSKNALYRTAAGGNPVQIEKLPRERLGFRFPITTEQHRTCGKLAVALITFTVIPLVAFYSGYLMFEVFAFVIGLLYLMQMRCIRIKTTLFCIAGFCFSRASLWYFLAEGYSTSYTSLTPQVLVVTVCYTVFVAWQFRQHWVCRASCGMLPAKVISDFRRSGQLPAGLQPKSTFFAFIEAMRSWASYDPDNAKHPGLLQSRAGDAQCRTGALLALGILWSGILTTPEALRVLFHLQERDAILPLVVFALTLAIPICTLFIATANILGRAHALIEHQFDAENWAPFIQELQQSPNKVAGASLYLGRVFADGSPILYPAESLMRGGWIQGSPGSGKTLFMMQLLEQLIELGYSVVTLDCKATSHELYWAARASAQRVSSSQGHNVPIYPFTPVHGHATHLIDIYSQPWWPTRSPEEKAGIMMGFLGLNYSSAYGKDYFRDAAWTVKQHVTNKYPNIRSFFEASTRLSDELQHAREPWELSRQAKQDGEHPRMMLRRLGMVDAVNFRPSYSSDILDSAINLEQLFHHPTVLHCALPALMDPVGNPEVGRVILNSLLATAAQLQSRPVKVVVLIDEFQRMVSRSLDIVLQQARSRGIGIVLTNQSSADLLTVDQNMVDTIVGNTAFQAWIKATDSLGKEQVRDFGGQYIDVMKSKSVSRTGQGNQVSNTETEHLFDRVSSGLIDQVNSANDQFFFRCTDDAGYSAYGGQLFVARMGYHTATKQEYIDRTTAPWPAAVPGMLTNGQHRPKLGPPGSALMGPPKPKQPPRLTQRTPTPLTPHTSPAKKTPK